jgi:hypothetical protein
LLVVPATRASVVATWLNDPIILTWYVDLIVIQTPLDLDGDGVIDFTFTSGYSFVGVRSEGQNRLVIAPSPPPNLGGPVEPLFPDYEIGPELEGGLTWRDLSGFATLGIYLWPANAGHFLGQHAYMGVEFYIDGNVHYGWINLMVADAGPYGEIYGWAYESESGVPIIAGDMGTIPEPSTLALLGLGLFGICARRLRRQTGDTQ